MSSAADTTIERWWRASDARHGWQLLGAVVIAYALSLALQLPESLWAVMSALIVVRPTTGSSLGVGWERVQGTVLGAVFALGGVWLHHVGLATSLMTLVIVGALAFGSAVIPALRSAPITALIVLGGAATAEHNAMQLALLRVIEIGVGVGTGLAISLLGSTSRAAGRFDAACARVLRQLSSDIGASLAIEAPATPEREAQVLATRNALRDLAALAEAADREDRWFRAKGNAGEARRHRRAARLVARASHDAALFGRLAAPTIDEEVRDALTLALAGALASTADELEGSGTQDLESLRRACAQAPWAASPAKLLMQDLIGLARLRDPST